MELDNKKQILYFDTDQEFTDFALAPHAVIKELPQGVLAYGGRAFRRVQEVHSRR